jgi:hypothetical protein
VFIFFLLGRIGPAYCAPDSFATSYEIDIVGARDLRNMIKTKSSDVYFIGISQIASRSAIAV